MVGQIKEKLIKYFKELPLVITCVAALNPILNRGRVETLINNIAYDLGLTNDDDTYVSRQVARFNAAFDNMFQVYLNKFGSKCFKYSFYASRAGSISRGSNRSMQMYNLLVIENRKHARGNTPSSELGRYGASDFLGQVSIEEFNNLDILGWWKARESQFLVLAAMARDLLSVQTTTVAFESAFSVSGRVIIPRRTKLTTTLVEVCICLNDHVDSIKRIQHISPLEGDLERVKEPIHAEEIASGYVRLQDRIYSALEPGCRVIESYKWYQSLGAAGYGHVEFLEFFDCLGSRQGVEDLREVSNDDTAVAQRRLEEKHPEEKTNTDCLVKEQEKEDQTGWKIKTGNVFYSCNQRSIQQCTKNEVAKCNTLKLGRSGIMCLGALLHSSIAQDMRTTSKRVV
ncbi:zinc finger BED domain-containing protein RICESLEEPER 2-like protein [Tanacetum coccineum]